MLATSDLGCSFSPAFFSADFSTFPWYFILLGYTTFSSRLSEAFSCICFPWESSPCLFLGRIDSLLSVWLPVNFPNSSELVIPGLFTLTAAPNSVIVWLLFVFSITACSTKYLAFTASSCCSSICFSPCRLTGWSMDFSLWSELHSRPLSSLLPPNSYPSRLSSSFNSDSCSNNRFLFKESSCWSCRWQCCIFSRYTSFSSAPNGVSSLSCLPWSFSCAAPWCLSGYLSKPDLLSGLYFRGSSIIESSGLDLSLFRVSFSTVCSLFLGSSFLSCRPRYNIFLGCTTFSSWLTGALSWTFFSWESPCFAISHSLYFDMIGSSMSLFLQVDFPSSSKLVISRLFTLTDASSR